MLIDDADIAGWNNENLPSDRMSIENATILLNSDRWPLMIDPQLQGIKWIKTFSYKLKKMFNRQCIGVNKRKKVIFKNLRIFWDTLK